MSERPVLDILLIEDNPADADLFDAFFRGDKEASHIHLARDGEEALNYLSQSGLDGGPTLPGLIFLDINLPKIDGKEVLKELKASPRLRKIPVIILTSSESEDDIRFSYESGASCVLIKPPDLDGVLDLFRATESFWVKKVRYSMKTSF